MNTLFDATLLLLVMIWPLLLAVAVSFSATRAIALRLVPWAALPALVVTGLFFDQVLHLPGVLMGSVLVLDDLGRVFLLLVATLWTAVGLLAWPRPGTTDAERYAVLLLLAMAGGLGLVVAADILLFFTAGTLTSYALYGLLVSDAEDSTRPAGRILVILLVVSDLVLFECLLLLGQAAGGVEFTVVRQALLSIEHRGLVLGLMIVGFGIKAGVVGVHFWLTPVFVSAVPALRPALIGFIFSAGLLGWLRLLPFGESHWPGEGIMLQWLAWVTLGYAVFMGLLHRQQRAILACVAIALTGYWLMLMGSVFLQPTLWSEIDDALPFILLQAGFGLAALMLLDGQTGWQVRGRLRYFPRGVLCLAALLLVTVPVILTGHVAKVVGMMAEPLAWALAAITLLTLRSVLLMVSTVHDSRGLKVTLKETQHFAQASTTRTLLVASGLTVASLLAAVNNLIELSADVLWGPILVAAAAALLAWLSTASRVQHLLPAPGSLQLRINRRLISFLTHGRRVVGEQLPDWRATWLASLQRYRPHADSWRFIDRIEHRLGHWPVVLVILLLLGQLVAWLGGCVFC